MSKKRTKWQNVVLLSMAGTVGTIGTIGTVGVNPGVANAGPALGRGNRPIPTPAPVTTVPVATVPVATVPVATVPVVTAPGSTVPGTEPTPAVGVPSNSPTGIANQTFAVSGGWGSLAKITREIKADNLWASGITGKGVDIAVIDTGVAPIPGLAGKIINGPDLSFDSQRLPAGIDAYGHGTHMAAIAAGQDLGAKPGDLTKFSGVAPDSRIVNVKVGAFDGGTDVSQVIAGIDWVVQHKNDNGMNIRVLNLSYGVPATQPYQDSPLSWAVENAWRNGIVVVVAAGNDGARSQLTSPASNPMVIAAGAADQTSRPLRPALFASATGTRQPDVWAPGSHVLSLRVPNSWADTHNPAARVQERFILGSGTSQAAAVVSGAAALLISAHPEMTPNQIKAALVGSSKNIKMSTGFLNVSSANDNIALGVYAGVANPAPVVGTPGTGSLEAARGGVHVVFNGVPLTGEKDIFGNTWNGPASAAAAQSVTSWNGGTFNGATWTGATWTGATWTGATWTGATWTGATWTGATWTGATWTGATWTGATWTGATWTGATWTGATWTGNGWAGATWL
jgi:serine protease AprX